MPGFTQSKQCTLVEHDVSKVITQSTKKHTTGQWSRTITKTFGQKHKSWIFSSLKKTSKLYSEATFKYLAFSKCVFWGNL